MQRVTLVRYAAKPDRAAENETLARAVFAELRAAAPDHVAYALLDVRLVDRARIGLVFGVVGGDLDARRLAVRHHLHALDDEAEPVPHDEDPGRARLAVAGVDQHALARQQRRLHAVAHHSNNAHLVGGRRPVAAHHAARPLPLRHHLLVLAGEPGAGAGAHVELLDADGAGIARGGVRRRRDQRPLAGGIDPGERVELARIDAARREDRHQLHHEIEGEERLLEAVLVMLVARAVLHAQRLRHLADREAGALAQQLQLAGHGGDRRHGASLYAGPIRRHTLFTLTIDRN